MDWLVPLVAGGLLLVFVIARGLSLRRARELRAWSRERGLRFAAGSDRRTAITFLEMPLIGSGRAGARNHASGVLNGQEVHAFDLVVGPDADDGRQSSSHHTCVLVKADLPLIPLSVAPRNPLADPASDLGPELSIDASPGRLPADRLDEARDLACAFLAAIPAATRREILGQPSPTASGD